MTAPTGATAPLERPAVGKPRQLGEGVLILTPLATVFGWLLSLLPFTIPVEVANALVALFVALGSVGLSALRDSKFRNGGIGAAGLVVPLVLLVFVVGCVHYNGGDYRKIADDEIVALMSTPDDEKLHPERCLALNQAAHALDDEEGESTSVNAPFFAGQHVDEMADAHAKQSMICIELLHREDARGLDPTIRKRSRDAWLKTYRNGRELLGDGS